MFFLGQNHPRTALLTSIKCGQKSTISGQTCNAAAGGVTFVDNTGIGSRVLRLRQVSRRLATTNRMVAAQATTTSVSCLEASVSTGLQTNIRSCDEVASDNRKSYVGQRDGVARKW
jgi:hypothetical protein